MTDTALDFLLEYLMQLKHSNHEFVLELYRQKLIEKDQIEWLYGELQFLCMFLKESEEKCNEHMQVKSVVTKIRNLTYKIEDFIDLLILKIVMEKGRGFHHPFRDSFMQEEDGGYPNNTRHNIVQDEDGGFLENIGDLIMPKEDGGTHENMREDGGFLQKIECAIMKNFSPDKLGVSWQRRSTVSSSRKKKNITETIKSLMAKKTHLYSKIKNILGVKSDHLAGIIRHGFGSIVKEIKSIRTELMKFYKEEKYGIGVLQTEESSDAALSNLLYLQRMLHLFLKLSNLLGC